MTTLFRFIALAALFAAVSPAFAADKLSDEQAKYFASSLHTNHLKQAFDTSAVLAFGDCKELNDQGLSVTFSQPLVLKNGAPASGAWKEQHAVAGCGSTKVLNFYAAPGLDGSPAFTAGMIGTTMADINLQRTAVQYAFLAATQKNVCANYEAVDTHLDQGPGGPDTKQVWYETWAVRGCGHTYDVPLLFTREGANTSLTADIKGVREHAP